MRMNLFFATKMNFIIVVLMVFSILVENVFSVCTTNYACDYTCGGFNCEYDPSTNSYYNSSITDTSTGYHGPGCCYCSNNYVIDNNAKTCTPISCGKDSNGIQLYRQNSYSTCKYLCSNSVSTLQIINQNTITWSYLQNITVLAGGDPYLGICTIYCSNGLILNNRSRICSQTCDDDLFIKQGTISHNKTWKICSQKCQVWKYDKYGSRLIQKCVNISSCPFDNDLNQQTYADNISYLCAYKCSDSSYGHKDSKMCVAACFGQYPLKNNILNMCVKTVQQQQITNIQSLSSVSNSFLSNNALTQKISMLQTIILMMGIILGVSFIGGVIFLLYFFCYKLRYINRVPLKIDSSQNIEFNNY